MTMSLNEPDGQALGCIEDGLTGSDPRLASMLNIFSRLAAGEEMPEREKIRVQRGRPAAHRPRRARRHPRRGRALPQAGRLYPRLGGPQAMLLLWVVVSAGLLAVALTLNTSGQKACIGWMGAVCSAPPSHSMPMRPLNETAASLGSLDAAPQPARWHLRVTEHRAAIFHPAGTFG
jgi:hypothetical protein